MRLMVAFLLLFFVDVLRSGSSSKVVVLLQQPLPPTATSSASTATASQLLPETASSSVYEIVTFPRSGHGLKRDLKVLGQSTKPGLKQIGQRLKHLDLSLTHFTEGLKYLRGEDLYLYKGLITFVVVSIFQLFVITFLWFVAIC